MLFLDPFADLVTCLDSNTPQRKKSCLEQSTVIRVVTARLLITGKCIKNAKELEISDNLLQCDSPITFDDFDILAPDSNKFKLFINEGLLIKRDKPVLNITTK